MAAPPLPPLIAPLLVKVPIAPAFDAPVPPAPPAPTRAAVLWPAAPLPPLIVPLLDRLVIVANSAFATPDPPAPLK